MHEKGMAKVSGVVAERKAIAKKIVELQIDLHNGRIDLHDFYDLIVLLKDDLIKKII